MNLENCLNIFAKRDSFIWLFTGKIVYNSKISIVSKVVDFLKICSKLDTWRNAENFKIHRTRCLRVKIEINLGKTLVPYGIVLIGTWLNGKTWILKLHLGLDKHCISFMYVLLEIVDITQFCCSSSVCFLILSIIDLTIETNLVYSFKKALFWMK